MGAPVSGDRREPPSGVLAKLRAGEPVVSLGVRNARTADVVRMAHAAGYDAIWVDLEHSSMPVDCAAQIAAAADALGMAAWVRTPERDLGIIGRLLDGGATGIISPKVETADEARAVAAACRFAPNGTRSQIALLPQFGFARMPAAELNRRADAGVVVQVLIESPLGVENVEAIAAVDGVDLIAIGINDLTAEIGCPGDHDDPRVRDACRRVAAAATANGRIAVVGGIGDPIAFLDLVKAGFAPLIFAGIDTDILAGGIGQRATDWRTRLDEPHFDLTTAGELQNDHS